MKKTVLLIFLAVIVFGQPAAVFATFSVQPQQAIEEPTQIQNNTATAEEQRKAEADAIAAVKALAAAETAAEAEAAASAEESSSGDTTFMFIVGGILTSIGVGAKFLIG